MASWKIFLCDKRGVPISDLSALASSRKLTEVLNEPTSLSFSVASDHPDVMGMWSDGAPKLEYIRRVVKAFRLEKQLDGTERYQQRFGGYVWPIEDVGENETGVSTVTCFDPLIVMDHRLARSETGSFVKVKFTNEPATNLLRQLVNRTNEFAGATGLVTAGGFFGASDQVTVEWEFKMISESISELVGGIDIWVDPLNTRLQQHGQLSAAVRRGQLRENTVFMWNAPPNTLSKISRTMDPADACNVLIGIGRDKQSAVAVDAANAETFMQLEAVKSFSDVKDQAHLEKLVSSELYDRLPPQGALTCTPAPNVEPWRDFATGDRALVGADTSLRGGVPLQEGRIAGFTITISDEDDEDVSAVLNPDGVAASG